MRSWRALKTGPSENGRYGLRFEAMMRLIFLPCMKGNMIQSMILRPGVMARWAKEMVILHLSGDRDNNHLIQISKQFSFIQYQFSLIKKYRHEHFCR